jgi:hypothetical protein
MKKLLCLVALFSLFLASAQTASEKEIIIKNTDVQKLNELKNQFNQEFLKRKARIDNFLKSNPSIELKSIENGVDKEIYDIQTDGTILYFHTTNLSSSVTASANKVYNGGSLGLNLQGQNMIAGVWDSGPVRDTHVEFPNFKISPFDFAPSSSSHGTHVMGTILASGTNPNARGIAFDAEGLTYDWSNDYSEMSVAAASGLLVSNHSYWIGSSLSLWILGAYDSRAQQMDQLTSAAPFYLPVVSAGNDRNSTNAIISNHIQNKLGYDLIRGMNNAKNSLTVAAILNVPTYVDASSVQMSSFSSWGPTDDGRIKPEISAKGVNVFSPVGTSDTSYDTYQGTSMASPAVTGVCLLLQQHHNNLFSNYMRSSTLKGLVMHTAKEAGIYDGPDYEFGWGLIDAAGAAQAITAKNNSTAIIDQLVLNNATTYTRDINVSSLSDLKVSICWTDPASSFVNNGIIDPTTSYLVNDLDVKLTKSGINYYPWTLNKTSPFSAAVNTVPNNVDIFERVDIEDAVGTYTITVSHKGTLLSGNQNFSLIVTGQNVALSNQDFEVDGFTIYPNPTDDIINIQSKETFNNAKVKIIDISGKVVYANTNFTSDFIDVSDLAKGFYILEINNDNESFTKKFIKK